MRLYAWVKNKYKRENDTLSTRRLHTYVTTTIYKNTEIEIQIPLQTPQNPTRRLTTHSSST